MPMSCTHDIKIIPAVHRISIGNRLKESVTLKYIYTSAIVDNWDCCQIVELKILYEIREKQVLPPGVPKKVL